MNRMEHPSHIDIHRQRRRITELLRMVRPLHTGPMS